MSSTTALHCSSTDDDSPIGLHLRGIIIAGDVTRNLTDAGRPLGCRATGHRELGCGEGNSVRAVQAEAVSSTPPASRSLAKLLLPDEEGSYHYPFFLVDLVFGSDCSVLLLAPELHILKQIRPSAVTKYGVHHLRRLCNDQFRAMTEARIWITRFNGRVSGENKPTSLALYSENVMRSKVLSNVLGPELIDAEGGPFEAVDQDLRLRCVEPNSCRLTWNTGASDKFSLSVDRFGNHSTRLRKWGDFALLLEMLSYTKGIGALSIECVADPLRRSDTALQKVST